MAQIEIDIKKIDYYIGAELGRSPWLAVSRDRALKFAESTGNFQWVNLDQERARSTLPSGRTVVHNYLLLSLIPPLFDQVVHFSGIRYGRNRGSERTRFLNPLYTDEKIRIRVLLSAVQQDGTNRIATFHIIMEREEDNNTILSLDLQLLLASIEGKDSQAPAHEDLNA